MAERRSTLPTVPYVVRPRRWAWAPVRCYGSCRKRQSSKRAEGVWLSEASKLQGSLICFVGA